MYSLGGLCPRIMLKDGCWKIKCHTGGHSYDKKSSMYNLEFYRKKNPRATGVMRMKKPNLYGKKSLNGHERKGL